MIGENDKSMLERFKEWLGADFVSPKIKFTREVGRTRKCY